MQAQSSIGVAAPLQRSQAPEIASPERRRSGRRRLVIPLILFVAIGIGVYIWRTYAVADDRALLLYGNVDIREVNLGFRVPGKVAEVLKDEGDRVEFGTVIARLDAEPYARRVDEAAAQVQTAHAKLAMLEAGYRREEIEKALASVAEAEATLTNVKRGLLRKQELMAKKVSSQQELDDAVAAEAEAQARLNAARATLALQEAGFRPEEIAQARAEASKAEAVLASAKLQLSDTELTAPSDGVVMTRAYEKGAILPTGATLFTISLSDPVWVRGYVPESQLGTISPGMRVTITTDSHPDKPFEGQIGYISPQAEFTPKTVETPELRTSLVYRLRILISNPREELRRGMPVTVHLPERR